MSVQSARLVERLAIRYPIIQAPMAGVSTPAMAAAASNAGALGSLGLGAGNAEQAERVIAETRALTDKPFNLNFFCHRPAQQDASRDQEWTNHLAPYFAEFGGALSTPLKEIYKSFIVDDDMQRLMLTAKPAVISFHFGLPRQEIIDAYKNAGIFLMATATCLEEARRIQQAGIDAIVAQGTEAGGHRGVFDSTAVDQQLGTFALVQLLHANVDLPIIAAGGIMSGRAIYAAEVLGAAASQLGTAFLLSKESSASAAHKAFLQSPRAEQTRITAAISGRAARSLASRFTDEIDAAGAPQPVDYPTAYDAGKQLHALASKQGSSEFGALWAGQAAALSRPLDTADVIATLVEEYRAVKPPAA